MPDEEKEFDPREYLLAGLRTDLRETKSLLNELKGSKVFFYPLCCAGGQVDLQPLHRFSHVCNVFIYVDETLSQKMIEETVTNIAKLTAVGEGLKYDTESIRLTIPDPGFPSLTALHAALGVNDETEPWIGVATLTRKIADAEYPIRVLFLSGNRLNIYRHLFSERKQAPRILSMRNINRDANRLFTEWNGSLRKIIAQDLDQQRPVPELIISDHQLHGWPWTRVWQKYAGWGNKQAAKGYVRPGQQRARIWLPPNRENRVITIRNGVLRAADVGNYDAALVSSEMYQTWTDLPPNVCLLVDCERIEITAQTARRHAIIPCPVSGIPMEQALQTLERICTRFDIQRVGSIPFGFEDEGPALAAWRRRSSNPLQITFHSAHEGYLDSLKGSVDAIIDA